MSRRGRRGGWFELVPGQHRARPVRLGLTLLILGGAIAYCGFTASVPFLPDHGTLVRAEFARNVMVRSGTPVRVHGVNVGSVEKVEQGSGGRGALITMRVEDGKGVDLRSDARAAIWWRTLLGRNMYIGLEPGSPSASPLQARVIPRTRTTTQVELDEVTGVLDQDGRRSIQTILREFNRGFADGAATGGAIDALGPAMTPVAPAMRAMRGTAPGDLHRLITGTSRTMGALARDEAAHAGLFDHGSVALGVTAARRTALGTALAGAPAALRQTRTTARRLIATLDELDPLAKDLRPGARRIPATVDAASPMLVSLDALLRRGEPTIARLQPTAEALADMAPDARALVEDARAPLTRTRREVMPFLERRDPVFGIRNLDAVGPVASGLASIAGQFDKNGHVIRFQAGASEQVVGSLPCVTYLLDPTEQQKIDCSQLESGLGAVFGLQPTNARRAGGVRR